MTTYPISIRSTGDLITAAIWNNDVVSSGNDAIAAHLSGNAGKVPRINAAGTAVEYVKVGGPAVGELSAITGDPIFPYNGAVTTDRTDAASASITDATYPGHVLAIDVWTINANIVMTMVGGPWFIFIQSLVYGNASSQISGDGPTALSTTSTQYALGGIAVNDTTGGQAGCGGVILLVCVGTVSGAAGKITANGGAGTVGTSVAATRGSPGQGALSSKAPTVQAGTTLPNELWDGPVGWGMNAQVLLASGRYRETMAPLLVPGGGTTFTTAESSNFGGRGGGSGGSGSGNAGGSGGSGIGGGGGCCDANGAGSAALPLNPLLIIELAKHNCRGGGGGAAGSLTGASNHGAAGGGGGAVLVYAQTLTTTPTLTANGGAAATGGTGTASAGGAGFTGLVRVPA